MNANRPTDLVVSASRRSAAFRRFACFAYFAGLLSASHAASNISDTNKYAYGANVGWVNARADFTNGAVLGEYVCSGYLWGANLGWIHLGDGTPSNGVRYSNTSAGDFGVNLTNSQLRGYAYGANVGWINFESNGNPRVHLLTGALDGYAWGANIGWISLSNAFAYVQANSVQGAPDGDGDGIADAWEIEQVGTTNILAGGTADNDGDGKFDREEYLSDTEPDNITDYLRVARVAASNNVQATLSWPSRPARLYRIENANSTANGATWTDSGLGAFIPDGTSTVRTLSQAPVTARFHRVVGVRPFTP
jgi:hypothetical protein